jgi:hypothetical protein
MVTAIGRQQFHSTRRIFGVHSGGKLPWLIDCFMWHTRTELIANLLNYSHMVIGQIGEVPDEPYTATSTAFMAKVTD